MPRRSRSGLSSLVQPGRGAGEDKYLDTDTPAVDALFSLMNGQIAASVSKIQHYLKITILNWLCMYSYTQV